MALKIVYKICCGIDIHKNFVVACIAKTDMQGVTTYERHHFSTYTKGLKQLLKWLLDRNCKDVCMESTGKYWIPVYNVLEHDCSIVLAHPKYVKAIRGKKTDKKDAKWIADLFKHDLVAGSFMPPADIRQLRDLMRYRFKLTCFKSSEKNRYQNCLTVSNIQLASVVSDTFGKSSQKIIAKILENPDDTSFDIGPLIHGSMKNKLPELELAIDGYITPEQAAKLKIIKEHFDNLEARKAELEELILALANPYQQEISIILTAPGFKNTFTAIGIISEIGTNMEAFLRRNTYVHGLVLLQPTMKVQGRKNLSGFPRPDAISNHFLYSVQTLRSRAKSILKFVTATSVSKSVAVIRRQSLLLQECFLLHYTTCSKMVRIIIQIYTKNLIFFQQPVKSRLSRLF